MIEKLIFPIKSDEIYFKLANIYFIKNIRKKKEINGNLTFGCFLFILPIEKKTHDTIS